MRHVFHCTLLLLSGLMLQPLCSQAQSIAVESLSPELRVLLNKEMLAIQEGMMAIVPAYSSGDNVEVAAIAKKIEEGFILKQALTNAQKQELHSKLPEQFLILDRQFHYNAGMLAHAASNKKQELIGFYFTQLSEACAGCHSQFAVHKFPFFKSAPQADSRSH